MRDAAHYWATEDFVVLGKIERFLVSVEKGNPDFKILMGKEFGYSERVAVAEFLKAFRMLIDCWWHNLDNKYDSLFLDAEGYFYDYCRRHRDVMRQDVPLSTLMTIAEALGNFPPFLSSVQPEIKHVLHDEQPDIHPEKQIKATLSECLPDDYDLEELAKYGNGDTRNAYFAKWVRERMEKTGESQAAAIKSIYIEKRIYISFRQMKESSFEAAAKKGKNIEFS